MRLIFKYRTVSPSGFNQDFSFSLFFFFSLAWELAHAATCDARTRAIMNSSMRENLTSFLTVWFCTLKKAALPKRRFKIYYSVNFIIF